MKVGVLSDTHIPYAAPGLPGAVVDIVASMDAVIHAGDFQAVSVLDRLSSLAELYGVWGNMDPPEVRTRLAQKRILHLGGFTIGVVHGWGAPRGLEDRIATAFGDEKTDAIVYGHSHAPCNRVINGTLFFNPGSPTDKRFAAHRTMGILTLGERITGEIVLL